MKQKEKELWDAFCAKKMTRREYALARRSLRKSYWTKPRIAAVISCITVLFLVASYAYYRYDLEREKARVAEENSKAAEAKAEKIRFEAWYKKHREEEKTFIKEKMSNKDYSFIAHALNQCSSESENLVRKDYSVYSIVSENSADSLITQSEMSLGRRVRSLDEKIKYFVEEASKDEKVGVDRLDGGLSWLVIERGSRKYIETFCFFDYDEDKKEIKILHASIH